MLLRSIYAALLVALLALVPTAKAEVADDSAVGNATLTDTKHALDSSVPGIAHPTQLSLEPASEKPAPRIVNLVNFIRGIEPREPIDLVEPVREQIRLAHEHKLPTTFLIQYDALVSPAFTDLLKRELGPDDEVGAWLEVVQPQVEAAGLKWRGRFPWDWHTDVGFTIGYSPDERQKLMDVYMEKFKATFGRLPRSVGCWVIDAPTLNYLSDKYKIVAACICKDQMGTDGYNLWGGYWNQAYYPSRRNAFMPAQTDAQQLRVPIFRMLGSDPIYQYDTGLGSARQGVISLEPVYPESGGNPAWVRVVLRCELPLTVPLVCVRSGRTGKLLRLAQDGQGTRGSIPVAGRSGSRRTYPSRDARSIGKVVPGHIRQDAGHRRSRAQRLARRRPSQRLVRQPFLPHEPLLGGARLAHP